jgi:hypothetical protein
MEVRIERNLRSYRVKQKLATWVEEYGTGSGPGSPDGQPGWGGGSDRTQPAIHKLFNARAAAPIRVICMSRELLPQPKLFALILV